MSIETLSEVKSYGGLQGVYRHASLSTTTQMEFSVFVPSREGDERLPVLWYLSGLTCTQANVTEKGDFRRLCQELGIIFVAMDTSPRGEGVPDDQDAGYDFGLGAGFYVNATQAPFSKHYKMRDYAEKELPLLIAKHFPADITRQGITGHSMGGHGALTVALRNPGLFKSVSAFAPIVSPLNCPWGQKALTGYLGQNKSDWRTYDACALIEDGARLPDFLVDQGTADIFLDEQLKPHLLSEVCERVKQPLTLRMQKGYDHSYYFISTFMGDHLRWHAQRL